MTLWRILSNNKPCSLPFETTFSVTPPAYVVVISVVHRWSSLVVPVHSSHWPTYALAPPSHPLAERQYYKNILSLKKQFLDVAIFFFILKDTPKLMLNAITVIHIQLINNYYIFKCFQTKKIRFNCLNCYSQLTLFLPILQIFSHIKLTNRFN